MKRRRHYPRPAGAGPLSKPDPLMPFASYRTLGELAEAVADLAGCFSVAEYASIVVSFGVGKPSAIIPIFSAARPPVRRKGGRNR